ncbi:MAG: LysM peptidoglycan-binding domain-containing protein [Pseudomonadales bacterium]|nr:LysM peptidoglycan-binding domain-containing protein [Pseudomonadales bacterium]
MKRTVLLATAMPALLLAIAALTAAPTRAQPSDSSPAQASSIPRPAALQDDVDFWISIYTQVSTTEGVLHDERNLKAVYEKLRFAPNTPAKERQKVVDDARDRYVLMLRRIAAYLAAEQNAARVANKSSGPNMEAGPSMLVDGQPVTALSKDEQRVLALWGDGATPQKLLEASGKIRFQLGQADRFRDGIIRSTIWAGHIAETFANLGLPPELAALPHVESSFQPAAYSKVAAAGLWQFMRSTGRRYMRIDDAVDERLDPYRSTEAAAQLLAYNYRVLGSWPLALTAYNHGAAGMRRAKEEMRSDDYVTINRYYTGRTFGFASRNFYPSFLAALTIEQDPEKYFGPLQRAAEEKYREVELPAYVRLTALERGLGLSRQELQSLNPALRPAVFDGSRLVPRGYKLRVPEKRTEITTEWLAAKLGPSEQYVAQIEQRWHRIRRGDSIAKIAARYGVQRSELAALNGMSVKSSLRSGRLLKLPDAMPAALSGKPMPENSVDSTAAATYVVRRGDSLGSIATTAKVPVETLLRLNGLKNPDFVYEGQRINLRAAADSSVANNDDSEVKLDPEAAAEAESNHEQAALAAVTAADSPPSPQSRRVNRATSVKLATTAVATKDLQPQVEAQNSALGAAAATTVEAGAMQFSVAADGTIRVAAGETLGAYADWLGIRASRVRELNKLRAGQPVLLGQKLRLDFSRVSREEFETKRSEFHADLQARFFAEHRIAGTEVYVARRGDTLWNVTQRYSNLPVWLLQQYNPDVDFVALRAGAQVVVPRVENMVNGGGSG